MRASLVCLAALAMAVDARSQQKVLAAAGHPIVTLTALNAQGGTGSSIISRPLGSATGDIPDERFTASSVYRAPYSIYNPWLGRAFARHSEPSDGCWRPAKNAVGEYLQIDLGREYQVTGIATQGAPDGTAWVTHYKLQHSKDLVQWKAFPGEFSANSDGETIVINDLHEKVAARYVRIIATGWNAGGGIALRAELYGYSQECEANEEERVVGVPCAKSASAVAAGRMGEHEGEANILVPAPERKYTRGFPLGMEAGLIADGQITASSVYQATKPINADPVCDKVLAEVRKMIPSVPDAPVEKKEGEGEKKAAEGAEAARFAQRSLRAASEDEEADAESEGEEESSASEEGSEEGEAVVIEDAATSDEASTSAVEATGAAARFAHVFASTESKSAADAKAEKPHGGAPVDGKPDCGVYVRYGPQFGRLNSMPQPAKSGGWKAGTDAAGEWLQIDLGSVQEVDAVATQGRENSEDWVTSYDLQYSLNGRTWESIPDTFAANSDSRTLVKNVLPKPLLTRFLRFVVRSFHSIPGQTGADGEQLTPSRGGIGMRVEVYGPGKGQGCLLRCHAAKLAVHSGVQDIEGALAAANAVNGIMLETSSGSRASMSAKASALAEISALIGADASAAINCCGCACCNSITPNTCRGTAKKSSGKSQKTLGAGKKTSIVKKVGAKTAVPVQQANTAAAAAAGSNEAAAIAETVRVLLRGNVPGGGEGPAFSGSNARTAVAAEDRKVAATVSVPGANGGKTFYVVQRE